MLGEEPEPESPIVEMLMRRWAAAVAIGPGKTGEDWEGGELLEEEFDGLRTEENISDSLLPAKEERRR